MPQTQLGRDAEKWSDAGKTEFRDDLDKLTKLPSNVLRPLVEKIASTHPACNPYELAAVEADESALSVPQDLIDFVSSFVYIWEHTDGTESPESVSTDLIALGMLSTDAAPLLTDLLKSAEPFRETAKAQSTYIRVGAPIFVTLRGVVDLRLRFHKTDIEFEMAAPPTTLAGVQQVIMTNLTIKEPDGKETIIGFVMDEHDLKYMKRFVRNMERELEMSKDLLKASERKIRG
jgi:hypothetical protein